MGRGKFSSVLNAAVFETFHYCPNKPCCATEWLTGPCLVRAPAGEAAVPCWGRGTGPATSCPLQPQHTSLRSPQPPGRAFHLPGGNRSPGEELLGCLAPSTPIYPVFFLRALAACSQEPLLQRQPRVVAQHLPDFASVVDVNHVPPLP